MPHQSTLYDKTTAGYALAIEEKIFSENKIFLEGKEIETLPKVFFRLAISDACDLHKCLFEQGLPGFISECKELNLPFLEIQPRLVK